MRSVFCVVTMSNVCWDEVRLPEMSSLNTFSVTLLCMSPVVSYVMSRKLSDIADTLL